VTGKGTAVADDRRLRTLIHRRADVPTPVPSFEVIRARARVLRRRRIASASLVAAIAGTAIVFSLSSLSRLGDGTGRIDTGSASPSPSPSPSASPDPGVDEPTLELPPGWFAEDRPLPAMIDPIIVVAAGSWDFPRRPLIACGVQPALEALPPDGAFLWILRYPIGPGEFLGAFRHADPWPEHFALDLPSRPSDAECADGTDGSVRQYVFSGPEGLYYQVQVALGTEADAATRREVEQVLSSFRP
jgi:hypothetical protein